jgi:hypothetical protein
MSIDSSSQSGFVLNPWVVIVIGLVAAAGVGGWMWFSNPGRVTAPDGPVRIEAPSGTRSMELVETCPGDTQCERVAIYEFSQTGETIRLECELNLPGTTPLFVSVTPQWLADETILRIDYADAEGQTGSLLFDLVADCHPGAGTSG